MSRSIFRSGLIPTIQGWELDFFPPRVRQDHQTGLHLLLNAYVEDVQNHGSHFEVVARNTLTGESRTFRAVTVVLAAGSIESPKLLMRSSMWPWFSNRLKHLIGRGLTDHPRSR